MPIIAIADEIFYQGTETDFNTLSLYASLYACQIRNHIFNLEGNPPVFFPIVREYNDISLYLRDFSYAFQIYAQSWGI